MTDFHELLMVKRNEMMKKKAGEIFLVVYVILNIQIARKLCLVYSLDYQLHTFYITFKM